MTANAPETNVAAGDEIAPVPTPAPTEQGRRSWGCSPRLTPHRHPAPTTPRRPRARTGSACSAGSPSAVHRAGRRRRPQRLRPQPVPDRAPVRAGPLSARLLEPRSARTAGGGRLVRGGGRRASARLVDPASERVGHHPLLPRQQREHHQPHRGVPEPAPPRRQPVRVRLPRLRPQRGRADRGRASTATCARRTTTWSPRRGESPRSILLFGHSLGGAVAIDGALHREVAGLVVQSSFTQVRDMARTIYPGVPLHLIARNQFRSIEKVARLRLPKLFIHGSRRRDRPDRARPPVVRGGGGRPRSGTRCRAPDTASSIVTAACATMGACSDSDACVFPRSRSPAPEHVERGEQPRHARRR